MSLVCPNCEQTIPDNSPFTPLEIANAVEDAASWETLYYNFSRPMGTNFVRVTLRGKSVQVNVIEKIEPLNMPSNEYDRQGETYKAFLILEANGSFYRKEAHVDSYGDEEWTGPVTRVTKVEKTIQVWE